MSASFSQPLANTASEGSLAQKAARWAPLLVSPVLLLVALLGAGWLFVPANPAIEAPATTLGFDELHDLAASGVIPTTWVQQNYFGWLGWTLVILVIALALATAAAGLRFVAMALAGAGLVGLAINVFAVKGALTWGQFTDQIPNIRIGGYCAIVGYILAIALGAIGSARRESR
ncbi:MAG: hypothetical protein ABIR39_14570 [Nocardioides sp.]|uniref:hypothetical protein n=1 Tax=Nocardioides sp. TaxID=35761 RepID=UPI0032665E77